MVDNTVIGGIGGHVGVGGGGPCGWNQSLCGSDVLSVVESSLYPSYRSGGARLKRKIVCHRTYN